MIGGFTGLFAFFFICGLFIKDSKVWNEWLKAIGGIMVFIVILVLFLAIDN